MAARKSFITGITGQDGSYLAELLLAKGYSVHGMVRRGSLPGTARIDHLLGEPGLTLCEGDLCDGNSIRRLIDRIRPDEVYNLGAQSHVQSSFEVPEYTADATGVAVIRILEAIRETDPRCRFYQASSSELYGQVTEVPQRETTPFRPRSPYAAAKALAFHLTRNYREAYGLFAVNGILFNHESPRRGENFVTRKISLGVASIVHGFADCLRLGNLEASRDWGFAGDYVEAMWLMLHAETPKDYVIATGETHSVREFCELAFRRVGIELVWTGSGADEKGTTPDGRELVVIDPRFFRPAEVDLLLGDASLARRELGWRPRVGFVDLVHRMVDADLVEVGRRRALASLEAGRP